MTEPNVTQADQVQADQVQADQVQAEPVQDQQVQAEPVQDQQVQAEQLALAETQYCSGKQAFESGEYRRSIECLEKALHLIGRNSAFGGEVQLWLVMAYQAGGQLQGAIALCEHLEKHPDWQTRKQARRLVYILKAPQLQRPEAWMTKIPDLSNLDRANANSTAARYPSTPPARPAAPRPKMTPPPVDLTQVNTQDTGFVWVALGLILLIFAGFVWFS